MLHLNFQKRVMRNKLFSWSGQSDMKNIKGICSYIFPIIIHDFLIITGSARKFKKAALTCVLNYVENSRIFKSPDWDGLVTL